MGLSTLLRVALTRHQLEVDANQRAQDIAEDIARSLQDLPSTASRSEFAQVLNTALKEHRSLVSVELTMQEGPARFRYVASPGKNPLITQAPAIGGIYAWEP